jgi:NAD(P)-dependent dehydrogenase (short-subunit alcohol dehydrogenase family)
MGMDSGIVCVFGGTGFLGRRIVRHLRDQGFSVRVTSRQPGRTRTLFPNQKLLKSNFQQVIPQAFYDFTPKGARSTSNDKSGFVGSSVACPCSRPCLHALLKSAQKRQSALDQPMPHHAAIRRV